MFQNGRKFWEFTVDTVINILCDWVEFKVQKSLAEALKRYKKQEEEKAVSFLKNYSEKHMSSLSRQSCETKPTTKLALNGFLTSSVI